MQCRADSKIYTVKGRLVYGCNAGRQADRCSAARTVI